MPERSAKEWSRPWGAGATKRRRGTPRRPLARSFELEPPDSPTILNDPGGGVTWKPSNPELVSGL